MNRTYLPLWIFIIIVLATGMFFPKLMDYDAAEYASIAMHMNQNNSWTSIINRHYDTGVAYDYLDKPHLLFWSAWAGFKLFGMHDYGYRFVSVLMSLLAALATLRLGTALYNKRVGQIASIMFITSQAIILANHDVRTDSLLTSFVILAVWQLVLFIQKNKWTHLIWAGAFLACGVGTKGMIAVLVSGCIVFFYLLGQRNFKALFNWKWIILVASFVFFLSPVLYFYYVQFDLHPEKFINGSYNTSGIKFILWTQSFERFAGDRAMVNSPEFSFFFHTLLWAMLPWSILCYSGVFNRIKEAVVTKGASLFKREQLTFIGVWAMFIIMSMSSFKLPHYLNVLFPFMAIFTAAYIHRLFEQGKFKTLRAFRTVQWVIIGILGLLFVAINGWAFPMSNWKIIVAFLLFAAGLIVYFYFQKSDPLDKVWIPSAAVVLMVNFVLNVHFYPQIDKYQGGSSMAEAIQEEKIDMNNVVLYHTVIRTFDFYTGTWRPMLDDAALQQKLAANEKVLVFTNEYGLEKLSKTFTYTTVLKRPDFHITALGGKFLNPKTRDSTYTYVHLVALNGLK
ncbi:MAG TPA: glycosyltransferase family 39 protein [Phnomibacter sp.]|nr:glycosyltransferase family 39 protein [Phnomibacter sp.]